VPPGEQFSMNGVLGERTAAKGYIEAGIIREGRAATSYGGGISNTLAYLRDRVRTPEGALIPWTSPNGTPLRIAAAWARWGWADLTYALIPNGRFVDTKKWQLGNAVRPVGINKKSFVDGLYLITTLNFIAPLGADPNAPLTEAKNAVDKGEPYGTDLVLSGGVLSSRKGPAGLFGSTPSPLLLQNGWTDDLFPVDQALMIYNDTDHGQKGPVSLQFGDLGHGRGAEKVGQEQYFNDKGAAFFDAYLKKQGTPPAAGSVDVTTPISFPPLSLTIAIGTRAFLSCSTRSRTEPSSGEVKGSFSRVSGLMRPSWSRSHTRSGARATPTKLWSPPRHTG